MGRIEGSQSVYKKMHVQGVMACQQLPDWTGLPGGSG